MSRLAKMFLLKYQVHIAGKPIILAPQTIGPFKAFWSRLLARPHIRLSKATFSRDELSLKLTDTLGLTNRVGLASDIALRLPFTPSAREKGGAKTRVGLNVSGLLMNGGYTKSNQFGLRVDYRSLIKHLVECFVARPDCTLYLVPHVISEEQPVEDDYSACKELSDEFPGAQLAPRFANPSEAKSYIADLDFFMGARMHSCIAAFSAGVPVVPMAYSRKFEGMFGDLGYPHTVDCVNGETEQIFESIMMAFEHRERLLSDMMISYQLGLERLQRYESELQSIVAALADKKE